MLLKLNNEYSTNSSTRDILIYESSIQHVYLRGYSSHLVINFPPNSIESKVMKNNKNNKNNEDEEEEEEDKYQKKIKTKKKTLPYNLLSTLLCQRRELNIYGNSIIYCYEREKKFNSLKLGNFTLEKLSNIFGVQENFVPRDKSIPSLVHKAIKRLDSHSLKKLFNFNTDPNIIDNEGNTLYHKLLIRIKDIKSRINLDNENIFTLFKDYNVPVNILNNRSQSVLGMILSSENGYSNHRNKVNKD